MLMSLMNESAAVNINYQEMLTEINTLFHSKLQIYYADLRNSL